MTGELTITGLIMPIGGVKEKVMAAQRASIKNLIFPKENREDFNELDKSIKEGISVNFVGSFREIIKLCFTFT